MCFANDMKLINNASGTSGVARALNALINIQCDLNDNSLLRSPHSNMTQYWLTIKCCRLFLSLLWAVMQQTGCRTCVINFYDKHIWQICRRCARRIPGEPPDNIWGKKFTFGLLSLGLLNSLLFLCLFFPFTKHTCCCTNRNCRLGGIVRAGVIWESSKTPDSSADRRILTEFNTKFQSSNRSRSSDTCSVSATRIQIVSSTIHLLMILILIKSKLHDSINLFWNQFIYMYREHNHKVAFVKIS